MQRSVDGEIKDNDQDQEHTITITIVNREEREARKYEAVF